MVITKMITISTAHISKNTVIMLERDVKYGTNNIPLAIYEKAEFGWFIYVSEYYKDLKDIPDDVMKCLDFAKENKCEWLCLDCDGEVISKLPIYEW